MCDPFVFSDFYVLISLYTIIKSFIMSVKFLSPLLSVTMFYIKLHTHARVKHNLSAAEIKPFTSLLVICPNGASAESL